MEPRERRPFSEAPFSTGLGIQLGIVSNMALGNGDKRGRDVDVVRDPGRLHAKGRKESEG